MGFWPNTYICKYSFDYDQLYIEDRERKKEETKKQKWWVVGLILINFEDN